MLLLAFLGFSLVHAYRPHVHVSASQYRKRVAEPDGWNVQLWECDKDAAEHQQWNFPPNSKNQITLKSNGWCLDVEDYGTADESNVWASACHSDDTDPAHQNQNWSTNANKEIISLLSGKCLDVSNYGMTSGANVWIFTCEGADNQHWVYNSTDSTIRGVQSGLCLDAGSTFPAPCSADPEKSYPMCDTSLSFSQRVTDLISRLSVPEKIGLFGNGASAVSSLQLPPYQWWSEALHGVAYSPGVSFGGSLPYATSFPQVIGTGASFNRTLFRTIGSTISTEARAFSNAGQAGLTFWAPNINIFRDPRWGRGQETPGEDPYLNSEYAANFVSAMQFGPDQKYMKISSCCKHYAAYSLEDSDGVDRHHFDGNVTAQDWNDTYLVAFQSCIERAKGAIMCSYNANNGVPSCADSNLLTDYLGSWGFNSYITGDCGAVDDVMYSHQYTNTTEDTCAAVLHAGLDVDCGSFLQNHLQDALDKGTVTEADMDKRLTDLFMTQMVLGYFDPADQQQYRQIGSDQVNTPANQQLALDAARQGIVLLKNAGNALPLKQSSIKTLAVIGPNANAAGTMQGNYNGAAPYLITPLKGLSAYATVTYNQGCAISGSDTSGISAAVQAAQQADATVIVVGIDQSQESEGLDRTIVSFPGVQLQLLSQVAAAAKGPVIVVLESGSSVDLSAQVNDSNVDAILWVGYPGQSGGQAIAEVIYGVVNPAGRIPFTFHYASFINEVPMTDMGMRPSSTNPGRTYRFYTNKVVYPFGHGLSYTTFSYQNVTFSSDKLSARVIEKSLESARGLQNEMLQPINTAATVSVNVTNTGSVAGADVVLNFVIPPNAGQNGAPLKYLTGFERVYLAPGQSQVVTFNVTSQSLALAGLDGAYRAHYGTWQFEIGVGENSVTKTVEILPESQI